jgi:hypothetical protein
VTKSKLTDRRDDADGIIAQEAQSTDLLRHTANSSPTRSFVARPQRCWLSAPIGSRNDHEKRDGRSPQPLRKQAATQALQTRSYGLPNRV